MKLKHRLKKSQNVHKQQTRKTNSRLPKKPSADNNTVENLKSAWFQCSIKPTFSIGNRALAVAGSKNDNCETGIESMLCATEDSDAVILTKHIDNMNCPVDMNWPLEGCEDIGCFDDANINDANFNGANINYSAEVNDPLFTNFFWNTNCDLMPLPAEIAPLNYEAAPTRSLYNHSGNSCYGLNSSSTHENIINAIGSYEQVLSDSTIPDKSGQNDILDSLSSHSPYGKSKAIVQSVPSVLSIFPDAWDAEKENQSYVNESSQPVAITDGYEELDLQDITLDLESVDPCLLALSEEERLRSANLNMILKPVRQAISSDPVQSQVDEPKIDNEFPVLDIGGDLDSEPDFDLNQDFTACHTLLTEFLENLPSPLGMINKSNTEDAWQTGQLRVSTTIDAPDVTTNPHSESVIAMKKPDYVVDPVQGKASHFLLWDLRQRRGRPRKRK